MGRGLLQDAPGRGGPVTDRILKSDSRGRVIIGAKSRYYQRVDLPNGDILFSPFEVATFPKEFIKSLPDGLPDGVFLSQNRGILSENHSSEAAPEREASSS